MSIPEKFRPLLGRVNIVLSRTRDWLPSFYDIASNCVDAQNGLGGGMPCIIVADSLNQAFDVAGRDLADNDREVFVIGGGNIYAQAITHPKITRLYLTRVDAEVEGGDYTVSCGAVNGFAATTATSVEVSVSADSEVDFGFNFVVNSINGGNVSGVHGMGWWKENINKAIRGQVRGVQISAAALEALLVTLSTFALPVLNYASLGDAYAALNYSGGNAGSKVAQHFTASEYNYANGSLIDGDAFATWALMVWGEYVVTNSGNYSRDYLNAVKDLFEHFNGGEIEVPDPLQ